MKKIFFITILIIVFGLALPTFSFAQSQQQEEQMGKKLLNDLSNKTVTCSKLKDADFEKIGEYFMSQSIGDTSRHIAMNEMMKKMMGEQGEEQMHVFIGKRLSGCKGGDNFMMGNFGTNSIGWFGFGWIFMILFWGLVILAVVALIKWIANQDKSQTQSKPAVDILKERYAKGEITKKEFEEMKKDIN